MLTTIFLALTVNISRTRQVVHFVSLYFSWYVKLVGIKKFKAIDLAKKKAFFVLKTETVRKSR